MVVDSQAKAAVSASRRDTTLRISDGSVVVDQEGSADSGHSDFIATLPEDACRYGFYTDPSSGGLIFVQWVPEGASVKQKMQYSAEAQVVKAELGINRYIQASEYSEINEETLAKACRQ
ncbi:hypothetical protein [Streptomyces sp. NPDC055243]|uniref:hypothetical protein n=1 Tax=Streptomyces sp. NPDC055243 TaxID=3365720 RepID=UPI0037D1AB0F